MSFQEVHSEEIQEIIGRPPTGFIRWGTVFFSGLLIIVAIGSWYIRYPDIVSTEFTLTTVDGSRTIVAKAEGKLFKLMVKNGQSVHVGDPLLYSESLADHNQVLTLSKSLLNLQKLLADQEWEKIQNFDITPYNQLGELQDEFQTFYFQVSQIKAHLTGGINPKRRLLLLNDYRDLQEMERSLQGQLELQQSDYDLAKKEFDIHEKLFQNKALSSLEYQREKVKLLAHEMTLKQFGSSLIQNRTLQTAKQKELVELSSSTVEQKDSFLQSLHTLLSNIDLWKQKYIILAPVTGKVSFLAPWQEQQNLRIGQELMTIEPVRSAYQGLIKITQNNLGKLHLGQSVQIKLDGYPFREFGMIKGILTQISITPGPDNTYWGYVDMPHGLSTSYGKSLEYRNGLKGTAEIVTADRRLAERIFNIFKIEEFQ
jgi:multidrug resistance efflux pump